MNEVELFNKYILPNLEVVSKEEAFDGEAIFVSDLEEIKTSFIRDVQALAAEQAHYAQAKGKLEGMQIVLTAVNLSLEGRDTAPLQQLIEAMKKARGK